VLWEPLLVRSDPASSAYCNTNYLDTQHHQSASYHLVTTAIMQPVSLFAEIERPTTPPQKQNNVSSRLRLQLQTMFTHQHSSRSKSATRSPNSTSSSVQSSPTPSYRSYSPRSYPASPASDISALFTPLSASSHSSSQASMARLRRQPSAIDLVLEAERYAVGAENIGLGFMEPRPRAPSAASTSSTSECSILEFMNEHQTPRRGEAVVLDGIFEVMESS
jgi:hypothetical protein